MTDHTVELFVLKCAVIETGLRATLAEFDTGGSGALSQADDEQLEPFIKQFDIANRKNAAHMSRYYDVNRLGMGTLDRRANGTPFGARR